MTLRARWLALAALAAAAGLQASERPGPPPAGDGIRPPRNSYANPSAVIAAEIAFAQLARDKGQHAAFRATATTDGVLFVPEMVIAADWLKDRPEPQSGLAWQPHEVWSSCDGSLMVSHGAWQSRAGSGYFTRIWRREPDGGYRWVLNHGDATDQPLAAPEMIAGRIAECPPRKAPAARPPELQRGKDSRKGKVAEEPVIPFDPARRSGQATDGSLIWEVSVSPDGARRLSISWLRDGAMRALLDEAVAAPPARP